MTKTLVIGATSSLAFAICHELAAQGDQLILAGRDMRELQDLRQDLMIRHGIKASAVLCDLDVDEFDIKNFANDVPHIDRIIMAAGYMGNGDATDENDTQRIMNINLHSPELILRAFSKQLSIQKSGQMVVISSVAGDCIRKKNREYSLAKRSLNNVVKELQKQLSALDIPVLNVKPGFVDTPMTYGMKSPLIASREHVAKTIIRAMDSKKRCLYTPFFWQYIMLMLKTLPKSLINKLGI